jgi:hypothetical protein
MFSEVQGLRVLFIDGCQLKAECTSLKSIQFEGGTALMVVNPAWHAGGIRILRG